uniref:Uncharacterized protein n=1 Tax=Arundo donax TaxID=35708 RepID=A0A0A9BJX2_ARUDO
MYCFDLVVVVEAINDETGLCVHFNSMML